MDAGAPLTESPGDDCTVMESLSVRRMLKGTERQEHAHSTWYSTGDPVSSCEIVHLC